MVLFGKRAGPFAVATSPDFTILGITIDASPATVNAGDGMSLTLAQFLAQEVGHGVRAERNPLRHGVFRQTMAPGSGPPTHLHHEIEFAYVLSSQFKFKAGDHPMSVPVGTFRLVVPGGPGEQAVWSPFQMIRSRWSNRPPYCRHGL